MQYHAVPYNAMRYNGIICIFGPKKGNWGHITACWAAKRPPSRKLKVSRVTSGYVDVMISLSQVRLSPKKKGFYRCSVKKIWFSGYFWAKNGLLQPPRSSLSNMSDTKTLSFWCLVMMVTKKLEDVDKKLISGQKTHFWAQKGPLWAIGAEKRPAERPNSHLPENQSYQELPQDMGDLWSHWVGFVWPQKMGVS